MEHAGDGYMFKVPGISGYRAEPAAKNMDAQAKRRWTGSLRNERRQSETPCISASPK